MSLGRSDPLLSVITPHGRLDALAASHLEQQLDDTVSAGHRCLILSLKDATYMCSSCLRVLFLCLRRLRALGGDLVLCSLPPRIEFILRISGFDQVFTVVDTLEAAECFFRERVERD